VILFVIE